MRSDLRAHDARAEDGGLPNENARLRHVQELPSPSSEKRRAAGCDSAARAATLDALPRLLGRVGQLEADDVDIAPVGTADQSVGSGASRVLVHARIAHEDVCPGKIDRNAGGVLV